MPTAVERMKQTEAEADRELERLQQESVAGDTPQPTPAPEPSAQPPTPAPQPQDAGEEQQPQPEEVVDEMVPKAEYDRAIAAHRTLQGKYNAEVPRLIQKIDALETKLEMMRTAPQEPPKPAVPPHLRHVKPEEVENLDKEALDLQSRMARGEAEAQADIVREEMAPTIAEMKRELARAKEASTWAEVEAVHPGAHGMDVTDPDWDAFLNTRDECSGFTYKQLGKAALDAGDSRRLISIITKFKSTADGSDTQVLQGSERVMAQVKPATARVAQTTRGTVKPTFKQSDYLKFISDANKGVYRGKPDVFKRLENEFDSAIEDGRLILGQ